MYGKKRSTSTKNISICVHCNSQDHQRDKCPLMQKTTAEKNKDCHKKDEAKTSWSNQSINSKISVKVNKSKNDEAEKEENKWESYFVVMNEVDFPKKVKKCNFCEEYGHLESNCLKKVQYIYDMKNQNQNKFCSFCGSNDHSEKNCLQKSQIEYNINYCNLCNNYGHCNCSKNSVKIDYHIINTNENKKTESSAKEKTISKESRWHNDNAKSVHNELESLESKNSKKVKRCSYCFNYGHSENSCLSLLKNLKKKQNEEINSDENQSLDMLQKKFKNLEMLKSYEETSPDLSQNACLESTKEIRTPKNCRNKKEENEKRLEGFENIKYCKICDETGHTKAECDLKLYSDYYSKCCIYCKSNGHLKDDCPLYAEFTEKIDHVTIYDDKKKQSRKKQEDSPDLKICTFCGEIGHTESSCIVKEKTIYYSQYCDYCNDDGHIKDTCPFLVKSVENMQESTNCNDKKNAKSINLEVCKDLEYCNFCEKLGHTETVCFVKEQSIYYSQHCESCNDNGHTKDMCPQILDFTGKKQKIKDWCDKKRESSIKVFKQCTFCEEMGHTEQDCFVKEQSIFYSKHCDYCDEDGHFKDTCPILIEKNTETNSVTYKVFCTFCGKIDHNESDCLVKENYDKYCDYCKKHGHTESTCRAGFKIVKNNKSKSQTRGNKNK